MEDSSASEDVFVSIPRGGPIYIADMVGPLSSVYHFQSCIEDELKDLKKELCLELTEQHRHEISVDELKIVSEEDLVDIAFQASLKGGNLTRDPSLSSEDCSDGAMNDCRILDNGKVSKKMKRGTHEDTSNEEDYMAEVEKLARIKQKQEEDKSAARLHSFSGTCGPVACVTPSEKKERMSSFNSTSYLTQQVKSSSTREQTPVDDNEILLCIEVYNNKRTWVKSQEILVLGRQFLTELKDKIYCLTDEIMKLTKKHGRSGYFLIEDTFYNDLRESNSTDYSRPILDWLRESEKTAVEKWESIISGELQQKHKAFLGSGTKSGPTLPRLKPIPMQSTRFSDLKFRLGAGYLYCHQGDCKHTMVIRDMRLIHSGEDVQNFGAYPLIMFQTKLRFQKCSVCKIYKATKVTLDDKWAPENPCFFCAICYYMLHYSNNQLIYNDFKVFDYIHE